ncbi:tRNA (guanine-N(7)-)-methyltransferase non-catalytic subunit Trm82p [[Candida] anglica]|uniref:tRNA (Guanine-N(7)-)-methyltransferase non-catalytic subunit Trm82p n=1 Tax=[Candida] anglica TaxID=148631 RepID=A0ABP0EBV7_9ASCO
MKHPFQNIVVDTKTQLVFAAVDNGIRVFSLPEGKLVGQWIDDVVSEADIKKRQKEQKDALKKARKEELVAKALENGVVLHQPSKKIKPSFEHSTHNYIRSLQLDGHGKYLVATTDTDKSVVVFSVDATNSENCLTVVKRQPFPKRPCSIDIDRDSANVVVADKFGDVYTMPLANSTEVLEEKSLLPILGHVSMLTDVAVTTNATNDRQYILTADRDEHIRVSNYPKSYVVKHWLFGHHEFVSCLNIDGEQLVSGGGDDYICLWNWYENKLLAQADIRQHVDKYLTAFHDTPERWATEESKREISVSKILRLRTNLIAVLVENVKCLLVFEIKDGNSLVHKQTLELSHEFVDVAKVNEDLLLGSNNDTTDEGQLFSYVSVAEDGTFSVDVSRKLDVESITVASSEDMCPLWYVNTLRKRSEH